MGSNKLIELLEQPMYIEKIMLQLNLQTMKATLMQVTLLLTSTKLQLCHLCLHSFAHAFIHYKTTCN